MIFSICGSVVGLLRVAVRPGSWRRGVGSALLGRLDRKLTSRFNRTPTGYDKIGVIADIPDDNLRAQFFFRKNGYRAVEIDEMHRTYRFVRMRSSV